jgi:hypothetical protein
MALPERSRTVLEARFGLGASPERVTLEAIGKRYGITRERVRQIENHALAALKKSPAFAQAHGPLNELERIIDSLGGIVCEDDLLNFMTKDKSMQNHIYFLLVLGDPFKYRKEDDEVQPLLVCRQRAGRPRLRTRSSASTQASRDEDLIPEGEMIDRFLKELQNINDKHRNDEVLKRWLAFLKASAKTRSASGAMQVSPKC